LPVTIQELDVVPRPSEGETARTPAQAAAPPSPVEQAEQIARTIAALHERHIRLRAC
jgi:hypothetical protein